MKRFGYFVGLVLCVCAVGFSARVLGRSGRSVGRVRQAPAAPAASAGRSAATRLPTFDYSGKAPRENRELPQEQRMGLPKEKGRADAFDELVTRRTPRFTGAFTVGLVFVNFPDCEPVDVATSFARQTAGVEDYYRRYTLGRCWPVFKVLGVYEAPQPLGYYVERHAPRNLLGGTEAESAQRVDELWEAAFRRVGRQGVDVCALVYATTPLPLHGEGRTLEQLAALRAVYPKQVREQSEAELRAVGFRDEESRDPLRNYRPAASLAWGAPLWPNSRMILQAEGAAATMIHELGHTLGAPDTYHAPERRGGVPGWPVIAASGPTAPLYCRYRYCGLLGPEAYPTLHQSATVKLAPRWGDFDGSAPLGLFVPTEHPNYLLHLEYEPSEVQTFDNGPSENDVGRISTGYSPKGGVVLYYVNVARADPYQGPPDLVYSYRRRDPYFRGSSAPDPSAAPAYRREMVGPGRFRLIPVPPPAPLAIFREGDRFDAESDPANRLPNQLPTGVDIVFGPQDESGAEVTISVPTKRLSGRDLQRSLQPIVRLEPITEVQPTSFRASLTMVFRGEEPYEEFGFCYGPAPNPTIKQAKWPLWGFSDWRDSVRITGLKPGTTLYVRAYARNAYGLVYSPECHKVVLPRRVDEVPPLLLDSYKVAALDGYYDNEGYRYNASGACALMKVVNLFRRPVDALRVAQKGDSLYHRLHQHPNALLPPDGKGRFGPTVQDLAKAYAAAYDLAVAAGLYGGDFPADFEARVVKALKLKPEGVRMPPDFAKAAREAGLSPAQAKALCAPVVPLGEVELRLLLPRIQASLRAGYPILCVRSLSYNSRFRYGLTSCVIDGVRAAPEPGEEPLQLHINFATPQTPDYQAPLTDGWYAPSFLLQKLEAGRLIFLNDR